MASSRRLTALLSASLLTFALSAALAQTPAPPAGPGTQPAAGPGPRGPGPGPGMGPGAGGPGRFGWGPGMMMGPGMMGGSGFMGGPGMMCDPRAAGLAGWRLRQVERAVTLTDVQRKSLDDLRTASAKAADTVAAACPTEIPATSAARLAFMEKRMEAMLAAIKTVRPAFDTFYGSLSDEQKARLDAAGPRRWGWRGERGPRRGDR